VCNSISVYQHQCASASVCISDTRSGSSSSRSSCKESHLKMMRYEHVQSLRHLPALSGLDVLQYCNTDESLKELKPVRDDICVYTCVFA